MTRPMTIRTLAVPLVLAMLLVACGQKPGVRVDSGPLAHQGGGTAGDGGEADDGFFVEDGGDFDDDVAAGDPDTLSDDDLGAEGTEPAEGAGDGGGDAAAGGDGSGGASGDGQSGQQETSSSSSGGGGGGGGTREPQGSDRTGVTDDAITLAIHAPVTGAAPLPSTSFEKARDIYWRWVIEEKGQKILGRSKVDVIFADDRYEPTTAVQVCRQLASRAFSVAGGGGTDQIQACGGLAAQARIPYISPGVTEAGLEGNPWYFASSMTYKQQGPLLAQMVKKEFGNKKTAAVIMNTPNFNDALQGWEAGVKASGLNYFQTFRSERSSNPNFGPIIQQLQSAKVEVVYVNMSPLNYIQFAQAASGQGAKFQFVGVGVTMGLNAVLSSGCPDVDKGMFFSPFPAIETANKIDPDFIAASRKFNAPADDIAFAIWGLNKAMHEVFKRYEKTFGNDLTREDLRAVIESAGKIETGVFPPVQYSPQQHFGGTGVHVLRADCSRTEYRDAGTFKTRF
jgi:branched-chain amino acid transport system substrate-binding protein